MFGNRLINTNAGGGGCTDTVDLYNPFPDGGGVALYQLNGDATDVSGNYNGTASNVTYGAGEFSQAGVFNGTSSWVDIRPLQDALNLNPYSFSVWINPTDLIGNKMIIFTQTAKSNFGLQLVNSVLYFYQYNAAVSQITITYTGIQANTWTNIVGLWDGSNIKLYVDSSLVGSTPCTSIRSYESNAFSIGRYIASSTIHFNGLIDQVRIFNRALRPYEVEALYTEEYCTPTIVPSEHFNTVLWTGNEVSGRQITGVGFQPDFVWIKDRGDGTHWHNLFDSVRGASERLFSNTTNAESFYNESLQSFNPDGFTVGLDPDVNRNGGGIVAWNFKAGGAAVTNTDGTITSQVSANTDAGFSVVAFTSPSSANQLYSLGHGLTNTPKVIITKERDGTLGWVTYHESLGFGSFVVLDATAASNSGATGVWGTTPPNESVFEMKTSVTINTSKQAIAYCFAEVEGFSNFGSYVGTNTRRGIVTGFEPAFVMIKRTDAANSWFMIDNKRFTTNQYDRYLLADSSGAEGGLGSTQYVSFLENGFSVETGSGLNASGGKYIYMAFAADPTAVEPTLEDSFNTVLYTGNGSTQSITGVGFQPDFTWIKGRQSGASGLTWHLFYDILRGTNKVLASSATSNELSVPNSLTSFNSDGFSLGSDSGTGNTGWNQNGISYVAWNWKGAEIPAINGNGSITSIVSANLAAGFSIVSYTGNGITTGQSFGHGLSERPNMIIVKNRTTSGTGWNVLFPEFMTSGQYMALNLTNPIKNSVNSGWGGSLPDSSKVFVGGSSWTNTNGNAYIAYCFTEVAGFSKFGSYTGTGSAGNAVTLGFEPAFVMFKNTSSTGQWWIHDNKRGDNKRLFAESSAAESTSTALTTNATGFSFNDANSNLNSSGATYIYMAFANQF